MAIKNTGQFKGLSKRATLLFLCVVFVFTTSTGFFITEQSTYGQDGGSENSMPIDRAKVYTAYHFLKTCLDISKGSEHGVRVVRFRETRSKSEMDKGEVFTRRSGTTDGSNLRAGWLVSEGSMPDGDGWAECTGGDPGRFLKAIDIDPLEFFTTDTGIFESGASEYTNIITDRSEAISAMREAFEEKFPSINFGGDMTSPMQYWPLLATARKKCKVTDANKVDDGGVQIKIVSVTTGAITIQRYQINGSGDQHSVGWGLPGASAQPGNRGNTRMSCDIIISRLNFLADITSSTVKNLLETGVDPVEDPGDGSGEATDALEASCNMVGALTWILCPVYELLEGAATQLANGMEGMLDFTIGDDARVVWANFRTIANIMFVLALLAIILSQTIIGKM